MSAQIARLSLMLLVMSAQPAQAPGMLLSFLLAQPPGVLQPSQPPGVLLSLLLAQPPLLLSQPD